VSSIITSLAKPLDHLGDVHTLKMFDSFDTGTSPFLNKFEVVGGNNFSVLVLSKVMVIVSCSV
jgi:hypothetical protein